MASQTLDISKKQAYNCPISPLFQKKAKAKTRKSTTITVSQIKKVGTFISSNYIVSYPLLDKHLLSY